MNLYIEFLLLIFIVLLSIGFVFLSLSSNVQISKSVSTFEDVKSLFFSLDHVINDVYASGTYSQRVFSFNAPRGIFNVYPEENVISYHRKADSSMFEYGTRYKIGNVVEYFGADVNCYYSGDYIILENSLVYTKLRMVNGSYSTSNIIDTMKNKLSDTVIHANVTFFVNNNRLTSYGVGESFILRKGSHLPKCTVKYVMNSSVSYSIYISLSALSDFLSVKIDD